MVVNGSSLPEEDRSTHWRGQTRPHELKSDNLPPKRCYRAPSLSPAPSWPGTLIQSERAGVRFMLRRRSTYVTLQHQVNVQYIKTLGTRLEAVFAIAERLRTPSRFKSSEPLRKTRFPHLPARPLVTGLHGESTRAVKFP